ncbi:MAG: HAMP domain-containing histidine kinase [Acidobacteriota bacterium]|nr:HAMP domain-containing histidine kinase [Acidobacteriota bacterium]
MHVTTPDVRGPECQQDPKWLWLTGLWFLPVGIVLSLLLPATPLTSVLLLAAGLAGAPVPALILSRRRRAEFARCLAGEREQTEALRQQLATISHRVGRLREELSAANEQARLSHQLTLLGQFTAGFLHEYNNPLAILISRIEILLDERKDDAPLCADLEQMLSEARYMSKIAQTLFRALRRERGAETFAPCVPADAIQEATRALAPSAEGAGVRILVETLDVPRVEVPDHAVSEVLRGLLSNAITALSGREGATIWLRLDAYRSPGSRVVLRVEDNGPGVPESLRAHLFEPFARQSAGREHLGLGLFLAASLLDTYDGSLRYETRPGGGACFVLEMPAARFTHDQPFHWFLKGSPE